MVLFGGALRPPPGCAMRMHALSLKCLGEVMWCRRRAGVTAALVLHSAVAASATQ